MLCMPSRVQAVVQIPKSTLEAAKEAVVTQNNTPTSEVIRVGIGTQNFGTYQYKEITIFGTGDTHPIRKYNLPQLTGNLILIQKAISFLIKLTALYR